MTRGIKFGLELEFTGINMSPERLANIITEKTGIGIRYEGYNHITPRNDFKLVYDGSVTSTSACRGLELVSRPYTNLKEFLSQLRPIVKVIREQGGKVDNSCGIHVHHDINTHGLSNDGLCRLIRWYSQSDKLIFPMLKKERHFNMYCRPFCNDAYSIDTLEDNDKIIRRYEKAILEEDSGFLDPDTSNRYRHVNVTAKYRHGTVEFRQLQSTFSIDDIARWVEFTNACMYKANTLKCLNEFTRRELTRDNVHALFNKLQLDEYDYSEYYMQILR